MSSVADRLDRRIEILTQIVEDGFDALTDAAGEPLEVTLPNSLNTCRTWASPALGIEPIGDPASFTRHHPRHGSKVKEIDALIGRLPKTGGRARKLTATAEAAELRRKLANKDDLIKKLVGQLSARTEELRAERALRIDTERVLRLSRERERQAAAARGTARLALVGADGE